MVNACAPTVTVPERKEVVGLAVMLKFTVPLPVPEEFGGRVIQGVDVEADQAQPLPPNTEKLICCAAEDAEAFVGEMVEQASE